MKRAAIIAACIVAALVIAFAGFVGFMQWVHADSVTGDDGVAAGYADHVETGGPIEAAYQAPGPHAVTVNLVDDYTVAVPEGDGPWPTVVMVNGTSTPASDYLPILEHLASWGFVVVGNEEPHAGDAQSTLRTIDALSSLEPRADVERIALYGHSQGGVGAFNATAENGAIDAVYVASPASANIAKTTAGPTASTR
ncbi:alpha/beta hydrolase family protein [Corynebacterium aquatimens]|uniref:alpha/beta hydrolase family protein n=1 Tax=Corynebacterium aquatimens TaxID=1190508 RepID=UPI0025416DEC|nr:hypothetical protein [Corynebacterium aquatimens]